jgi:hypothetical protein
MISIPLHHQVNSEFLKKSENEQDIAIGVFLLFILRGHGKTIKMEHGSYRGFLPMRLYWIIGFLR